MAQNYARTENIASLSGGYHGYTTGYLGSGDPPQQATDSAISKAKPGIEDCSNTDYGVGFVRHGPRSVGPPSGLTRRRTRCNVIRVT
jgi:hypothetical protein